ncbi:MAG: TRAP transporter small permease [Alphaproteobacteria bacterium]
MASMDGTLRAGPSGLARAVIRGWALAGGVVLLLIVLMNVVSVLGSALIGRPFPGDFEMTEIGVAIAAFAFLPYCQITDSNVTADIFTSKASPRWIAFFSLVASLVALSFGALLLWRMWYGLLDQKSYGYETTILQFPQWIAFIPILISLALLVVASLITLRDCAATIKSGKTD